jgi:ectoine hydroxylase-related dioxygenase (phytanoyl-CoA dioxygenase family)
MRRNMHWPDPSSAIEVTAAAGDAVLLDRRIWHTRSRNYSPHTRKAVFFGYTYRRAAIRDDITPIRASGQLAPLTPSSGSCSVFSRTPAGTMPGATTRQPPRHTAR